MLIRVRIHVNVHGKKGSGKVLYRDMNVPCIPQVGWSVDGFEVEDIDLDTSLKMYVLETASVTYLDEEALQRAIDGWTEDING